MVFRPEEAVGRVSRDDFTAALDEAVLMNPPQRTLALLVVRIHGLHRLNATFGHIVNRRIVASLGERLRGILHGQDQIFLIADDEYGLILPNLSNRGHAELAATKILATIAEPFRVGATLHTIGVTIGIGTFAGQAAEAAQLLQRAELALASAEDTGKRYATYEDATAIATTASWDVEAELVEAVENGELELYYQPQLDLKTNKITGAEGLVRWRHPLRGFLTPNFFIGAAERSSQIRPLTWSTLNMALQRASQWPTREPALNIGVNISATLLSDPEFSDMVSSAVGIWDVTPGRLTLEITETALMHELDESYATVKRLHDMGFNISIDDFGTGYSSFSYFRNLPAREIKIDKCFIIKILDHEKDRDIVESLIDLAHKCDLRVVAEGVTDADTLEALRELGCDAVQGYYVAEPMSHSDFLQFLENNRHSWQQN